MSEERKLPTSRAARTAMLGRVVAGQAARHVGARISAAGRDEQYRAATLERRQAEAAKAIVTGLGTMRGAAMKIGQMLAVVDMGVFPEEVRDDMQKSMAALLDSAPTVSFGTMRGVIESDLGGRLSSVFAEFDETPLAAASIGQVYRARLRDGRPVAVKVQYPGIDKAIRADLRNLSMVLRAGRVIAPNTDWAALGRELRERLEDELDYELEARNQRKVARLYRGHPFITVPEVVLEHCGPHVLVSDFFEGARFEQIRDWDAADRNRVAETVFRFYFGSLLRHRQFSPDPHPGNFLVGADGRIAFLDFGLYKHLGRDMAQTQHELLRAIVSDSPEQIFHTMSRAGLITDPDGVDPEIAHAYIRDLFWWAMESGPVELGPEVINEALVGTMNPGSQYFGLTRRQTMPAEQAVVLRMMLLVMATAAHLRATGDWNGILREWLHNDDPATPLGVIENEFLSGTALPAI
ncbi:putative ATP-binding protein [Nocardia nova SH22a]|uniref:Putative ATP-binding protein n=1 Tax=Nocardia nova SH22a TaxID=1415166 RepID=W5TRV5_9NOCA|nr:AarF/ABC1/UbiB kinase family protein [Nocardia nova]AHH19951.1 putative ATP-binding protein [Nocardia nova SH22a]